MNMKGTVFQPKMLQLNLDNINRLPHSKYLDRKNRDSNPRPSACKADRYIFALQLFKGTISDRPFQTELFSKPQIFFFIFRENSTVINYLFNKSLWNSIFLERAKKASVSSKKSFKSWFSEVLMYFPIWDSKTFHF